MGIGIGVMCKICGEQLTSLDSLYHEKQEICTDCYNKFVLWKEKGDKHD